MLRRRAGKTGKESTIAYIGLGSNLGEREAIIDEALRRIDDGPGTWLLMASSRIETDPVGYEDQPRFVNAVASIATMLTARELLEFLLEVERDLGRVRGEGPRFGPRTIDLDLLLYGDDTIEEPGLRVPHPRMHERKFVLEPLAEIAPPRLVVPGRGRLAALLAGLE